MNPSGPIVSPPPPPRWARASFIALVLAIAAAVGTYWEGTRYTAYPDPATNGAPWTICQGHTKGVKQGDTATDAQCRAWLEQDMAEAYGYVQRCITYPLPVTVAAAFTDAAYNIGPNVVCGSTLQRLANAGDLKGACNQLTRWNKAAGREMPGLTARRADERALCLEGLR